MAAPDKASPPGQERRPSGETEAADVLWRDDNSSVIPARDNLPLRHNLTAIYVRDDDPLSVALRKIRRRRPLTGEHLAAYEASLAQQRRDAS